MPTTIQQARDRALDLAIAEHVAAIRTELRAMHESTLVHPADLAAAIAIEAHLDNLIAAAGKCVR